MTASAGVLPPPSSLFPPPSSLFPPPPSDWVAGSQGAGAALSVNGLRLRHVTQQQSPINNTASPGKNGGRVLVKDRQRRKSSQQQVDH